MAYTSHGHHIEGTGTDNPPSSVARCGGPAYCSICSQEVMQYANSIVEKNKKKDAPKMEIRKYVKKPFDVEAVQVTEENLEQVAKWSDSEIVEEAPGLSDTVVPKHIHIDVKHPLNKRQTQAFVNDWVLKSPKGFKVYPEIAFHSQFVLEAAPEELRSVTDDAE